MLRDVQLTPSGRTPVEKWAAMVAIILASVALVGLKPPPNRAMAQDTAAKPSAQISTSQVEYDLRYFSDEGGMLIAARPAELLASNSMSDAISVDHGRRSQVSAFERYASIRCARWIGENAHGRRIEVDYTLDQTRGSRLCKR